MTMIAIPVTSDVEAHPALAERVGAKLFSYQAISDDAGLLLLHDVDEDLAAVDRALGIKVAARDETQELLRGCAAALVYDFQERIDELVAGVVWVDAMAYEVAEHVPAALVALMRAREVVAGLRPGVADDERAEALTAFEAATEDVQLRSVAEKLAADAAAAHRRVTEEAIAVLTARRDEAQTQLDEAQ